MKMRPRFVRLDGEYHAIGLQGRYWSIEKRVSALPDYRWELRCNEKWVKAFRTLKEAQQAALTNEYVAQAKASRTVDKWD